MGLAAPVAPIIAIKGQRVVEAPFCGYPVWTGRLWTAQTRNQRKTPFLWRLVAAEEPAERMVTHALADPAAAKKVIPLFAIRAQRRAERRVQVGQRQAAALVPQV